MFAHSERHGLRKRMRDTKRHRDDGAVRLSPGLISTHFAALKAEPTQGAARRRQRHSECARDDRCARVGGATRRTARPARQCDARASRCDPPGETSPPLSLGLTLVDVVQAAMVTEEGPRGLLATYDGPFVGDSES